MWKVKFNGMPAPHSGRCLSRRRRRRRLPPGSGRAGCAAAAAAAGTSARRRPCSSGRVSILCALAHESKCRQGVQVHHYTSIPVVASPAPAHRAKLASMQRHCRLCRLSRSRPAEKACFLPPPVDKHPPTQSDATPGSFLVPWGGRGSSSSRHGYLANQVREGGSTVT